MKENDFSRYQLVKYKGQRYIVDYIDYNELYLSGSSNMKFMVGSKEFDSITTDEPLLTNDINLELLEPITKSDDDKLPIKSLNKEELIKSLTPKNGNYSEGLQKLFDNIKKSDFSSDFYNNIFNFLFNLNTEQLAKIFYSSFFSISERGEFLEENNPSLWIIKKLKSSYWRNGFHSDNWNQLVDSYESMRTFSLNIEGFSIKLDTTTGYNEKGYSRFNRIFLDGIFSYTVYHKNKLILNISFSFTKNIKGDNVLQLRQIQCVNKKGNRWIYKIPNYVEVILYKFVKHFTNHTVLLLKPEMLITELSNAYNNTVEKNKELYNNTKDLYNKNIYEKSIINRNHYKNHGINSINNTLGIKLKNIKRVRCSINGYNKLILK